MEILQSDSPAIVMDPFVADGRPIQPGILDKMSAPHTPGNHRLMLNQSIRGLNGITWEYS